MSSTLPRGPHAVPTVFALLLSVAALIVELTTHICASAFFDPLPDATALTAYVFLTGCIAVNAWLLRYGEAALTEKRERLLLGSAAVFSSGALCIALVYTLMFLPILPVSLLGVLAYGLGFCAWSPLFNLIILLIQFPALIRRWEGRYGYASGRLKVVCVIGPLTAFTVLVGHPIAIGYYYQRALTQEPREPSLYALRRLGGARTIHTLGYEEKSPVWIGVGRALAGNLENPDAAFSDDLFTDDELGNDHAAARKLYVLLTGQSFESAPWGPPSSTRLAWDRRDPVLDEQGGEAVGHAVEGVSLATSRIDGVIERETETAYQEWTMEFRNASAVEAEARAEVLLPEGGVINKVSLWINGEERPAAFGPRSVVRQAYQDVAVAQRRDPLLVTSKRPGQAMVQCFPILPGKTMKIRLGFTSPLIWRNPADPTLHLDIPSLQQVNFRLPKELRHEVWIEGKWRGNLGRFAGEGWSISNETSAQAAVHTARRSLPNVEILAPPSVRLEGAPSPAVGDRLGSALVRAESPFPSPTAPVDLFVVLDTSAGMDKALKTGALDLLLTSVAALPPGSNVRFVDGRETEASGVPKTTPWTSAKSVRSLTGWLNGRRYEGGTAPAPALRWAWEQALTRPQKSSVLWLHGAVSADVVDATALMQSLERRPEGPPLIALQLEPGPDALSDQIAGPPCVYSFTARQDAGSVESAVRLAAAVTAPRLVAAVPIPVGVRAPAAYLAAAMPVPLGGRYPAVNGASVYGAAGAKGSVRPLAVMANVLQTWYFDQRDQKAVKDAQKLAIRERVVTPLSGAVVLETKEQYDRYNLSDRAEEGTIPSVPEPGTLALLALAGGACALAKRRRRASLEHGECAEATE